MTCTRCHGLVLERYGQRSCINCSWDPDIKLITVKCSNPDCFALPDLNGFCTPCWHSRKRSILTEAQKAKMYREKQRRANAAKRAKRAQLKGQQYAASLHDSGELPRAERDYQGGEGAPDGVQRPQEAMG